MMRGGSSIHIERAADEVFAFVAEVENNPRWRSYVIESAWLDPGPMRVGRRGRQVSRVVGRRYEVVAEIVDWDPPRHVAWRTLAGGAAVRTDCTVEPESVGCRLTITAEGAFTGLLWRLVTPVAVAAMTRQSRGDLAKLVAAFERGTENDL
jgi:hypothetical protein